MYYNLHTSDSHWRMLSASVSNSDCHTHIYRHMHYAYTILVHIVHANNSNLISNPYKQINLLNNKHHQLISVHLKLNLFSSLLIPDCSYAENTPHKQFKYLIKKERRIHLVIFIFYLSDAYYNNGLKFNAVVLRYVCSIYNNIMWCVHCTLCKPIHSLALF